MDKLEYLLIVLIIIIIVLLLWNLALTNDNKKRKHAQELANKSAGGYDDYARSALNELESIEQRNRNAEDAFRVGTILEFNVLGGEITNAPRNIVGDIARNYIETVDRLAENMRERVATAQNPQPEETPVVIMIDHIENFADNDFIVEDDAMVGDLINLLLGRAAETIPAIRETERAARRIAAENTTNTREDATRTYMETAQTHTSDPQNVHDSHVNEDLRATLNKIEQSRRADTTLAVVIARMHEFIMDSDIDIAARSRAFKSLEIIGKNQTIGTLQCTEGHVFKSVWDRAEDPANAANETLIKSALAIALADFWENGENNAPVCINGRCSRMLASLVLLDYDDSVGAVQTKEMIKNEIIDAATTIIDKSIDDACKSQNEKRRAVGESYRDPKIIPDETEEQKFINEMKGKISNMMEINYRSKLSQRDYENIRDDIYAGL